MFQLMSSFVAVLLGLVVVSAARADGCSTCNYYTPQAYAPAYYSTPYSYYPAQIFGGVLYPEGWYRYTSAGWYQWGYGIQYGSPVAFSVTLPAVNLVSPPTLVHPSFLPAAQSNALNVVKKLSPAELEVLQQVINDLINQRKQ